MMHFRKMILAAGFAALTLPATAGQLIMESRAAAGAQPTGASAAAVPARTAPAAAAATPSSWSVKSSDGRLSTALLRWAREAGVQMSYEAPDDLPAVLVSYSGAFPEALDNLLRDTANGNYPLHGCQYNNVIRVLHISQPCDR